MKCNPWVGGSIGRRGFPMLGTGKRGLSTYVKELFANNEQGFFYDPNDLSTLYQDAAGTVPVTAVGQPVGLILDKSKGLELGSNVATGFTSGFIFAGSVNENLDGSNLNTISSNWFPVTPSAFYKIHAPVSNRCRVQVKNASGVITYLTDYSSELSANGRLVAALADSVFMRLYFANEGIGSQVTTFEVRKLSGNHAFQTNSASRPILRQNAITGAYYLEFDGSDDFFRTNSIDFTATDKVSLFAAIKSKLTLEGYQIVMELSASVASNNNSFLITSPHGGIGATSYASKGTVRSDNIISAIQVAERVISAQSVISTDANKLKVNGIVQSVTTDQGTGNYGNYPLYIGRRGGTSLTFAGHIYSLIGVGKLVSNTETVAIEKELAKRVGVTLSV